MKTITEFPALNLKSAAKTRAELTAAGKTAEELPAALGEALKLEGDRLSHMMNALEVLGGKVEDLKRAIVLTLAEGEKAPHGAIQKGEHYYAIEYYPPIPGKSGRPMRGKGHGERDGKGGKRGGKGGKRGGRRGEGRGERSAGPGGDRGPRPGGERGPKPGGDRGPRPIVAGEGKPGGGPGAPGGGEGRDRGRRRPNRDRGPRPGGGAPSGDPNKPKVIIVRPNVKSEVQVTNVIPKAPIIIPKAGPKPGPTHKPEQTPAATEAAAPETKKE